MVTKQRTCTQQYVEPLDTDSIQYTQYIHRVYYA